MGKFNVNQAQSPDKKSCPFCAELIQMKAIKCRFCSSMLVDDLGNPASTKGHPAPSPAPEQPPVLWKLLLWTLMCPGWGTWKLGYKWRGVLLGGGVCLAVLLWAQEVLPVITKAVNKAVATGNMANLEKIQDQLQGGVWYYSAVVIYIYSFIDVYILMPKSEK